MKRGKKDLKALEESWNFLADNLARFRVGDKVRIKGQGRLSFGGEKYALGTIEIVAMCKQEDNFCVYYKVRYGHNGDSKSKVQWGMIVPQEDLSPAK